ncbi:DNA-deoxyinosine glycosylase [Nitrosomonas sp. Is35]|uniref:DNA-deoxyinosine glycosylase n=1 Tax=Nitrosomonas sp. Is35 TaxID=3080534 RepID=UPI00294AE84B|nr:DNA-deoxyinosine glycosylase [Nitrosomonas sp. Is35]MDV6348785.1 DNA-deoxyinosine glycosylase [Nitrosomonas sp. Is35]
MPTVYSFPPIAGSQAKILILGSMPGEASLAAKQYYAHRRNAFWPIMAQLLHIDSEASYQEKIAALRSSPIALWDVLKSCKRSGSLDSMIETGTQISNDFQSFFSRHRAIAQVFFNGGTAEACFKRYVMPAQNVGLLKLSRLPSTSPANARLSFEDKCGIWHETIGSALRSCHPTPKIKQTLDGEARDAFYLCTGSTEQK